MIDSNPASITATAPDEPQPTDATPREIPIKSGDRSAARGACFEIPDEGIHFETFERDLILQAMEKSGWVIAKASQLLGMSYRTLQYRLDKFNLKKSEGPGGSKAVPGEVKP